MLDCNRVAANMATVSTACEEIDNNTSICLK